MLRGDITLTVVSTTLTKSDVGDATRTEVPTVVPGCLFAPRSSAESVSVNSPAVITGGTIYKRGPGLVVGPNDRIEIRDVSPMIDGDWQVEGDPGYWGAAGTEVAVTRWSNG